jgi:trk system potassium uptake protein
MKTIAVFGLSQFGYQVATSLSQKGFEIVACDIKEDIVDEIKDIVVQAVCLDAADEKAMRAANIDTVDMAIVAMGTNMQASLLTTALLQKMDVKDIYVRAFSPLQESILRSMGIKHILNIEMDMGIELANLISKRGIDRYIELSRSHSLMEINVPTAFVGQTLQGLNLRSRYRLNIVGIKRRTPFVTADGEIGFEEKMADVPDPHYQLSKDDLLIVSGTDQHLGRLIRMGDEHE